MMEQQNAQAERHMQAQQAQQTFAASREDSKRNYEVNKMKAKQKPAPKKP
jgi:flagellar biosynthesis/type III secretory pathway M-ring protein FliF/YscJ